MSFAQVEGIALGGHTQSSFPGNSTGIAIGTTATLLSTTVIEGTHVFSLNTSVFTSNLSQNKMDGECLVTFGGYNIGKFSFHSIQTEDICISGLIFSDGTSTLSVTISSKDSNALASAVSWGYNSGTVDFVRISSH